MSFLRHVGKIGDRKVAILFREVPGEPHLALVAYTETLNQHIHDPMMACIESQVGQSSENLADALNRAYTKDGKIILQVLHAQGFIKRVQTSQVMVTPNGSTTIRLDELNKILDEMKQGEEAVKKLADLDASRGLQDPADVARRIREMDKPVEVSQPTTQGILGDSDLARQRLAQAQRMEREAKGLLAEAQRLTEEAKSMDPTLTVPAVSIQPLSNSSVAEKKRGRPSKAKVTV
jgi:ribosomal protein S8